MKSISKYVDRLHKEWLQHKKIIVAVDFDDTVSAWNFNQEFIKSNGVIPLLKTINKHAHIVVFTACDWERYGEIYEFFEENGVKISTINKNPIHLPYGNTNKIYYNIFLDDRAGLNQAIEILETAYYKYKGDISENNLTDIV